MKRNKFIIMIFSLLAAVVAALLLTACFPEYSLNPVPDAKRNEVLFIERNRLSFAKDMDIDERAVIAGCKCTFTDGDGNKVEVTEQTLDDGIVRYESFDLSTLGSDKRIEIAYGEAVNYIYYDVNEYTVNFYVDDEETELYASVNASASLTDTLGLSVWVNIPAYNYSTDERIREIDENKAIRFDGWYDGAGRSVTGLYTLSPPAVGNERVLDLHARFITEEEFADMRIYYDAAGRRVFSGYNGSGEARIPEGVTYVELAAVFADEIGFDKLHIPSTAKLDLPLMSGISSVGLTEVTVDGGSLDYSSYDGALYSKDHTVLYFMPSSALEVGFHSALTEFGSYSCAYWQASHVTIPETVATLQHYCFAYSSITSVENLAGVRSVKAGVFYRSKMNSYTDGDKAVYTALTGEDSGKFILSMILDRKLTHYKVISGTVGIAGGAFVGCSELVSVDLGDSVETIGGSAFSGCASLKTVKLPLSLKYMGTAVFYDCKSLESVSGLTDVTFIDDDGKEYSHTLPSRLFYGCVSLSSVALPQGVTIIAPSAFYGCTSLTEIALPDGLEILGTSSFGASGIREIKLPSSLRAFGKAAFSNSDLQYVDFSDCTRLSMFSENCFSATKLVEVIVPERITVIPAYCFYNISTLKKVSLGNVKDIDTYGFGRCGALTSIDFAEVENIGTSAFRSCAALTQINLPDSVKTVGGYAFASCSRLTSATFGSGLERFGNYVFEADGKSFGSSEPVFYACTRLSSISVSADNAYFNSVDGVMYGKNVGAKDFGRGGVLYVVPPAYPKTSLSLQSTTRLLLPYSVHRQVNLTEIELNEGLENIGKGAFYDSEKLLSLTVPSTVTHIGANILLDCIGIQDFAIASGNTVYSSDGDLVYKGDTLVMYLGLTDSVSIRDGIAKIDSAVFMNSAKLTHITVPDSVTAIGEKAFNGCKNLLSLDIGAGLKDLSSTAFAALGSLETVTVDPANPNYKAVNNILYTKDGKKLLLAAANNGMTELDIADGVTEIGDWAFSYHKTLKNISLPAGIRRVGDYAFYECRSVGSLFASEVLESIGERAFSFATSVDPSDTGETRYCDTLKSVLLYGNIRTIGDNAFYGQYGISNVYFKMSLAELNKVIAGGGKNISFLIRGCRIGTTDKYYNNGGEGIVRALYSAVQPTIDYDGYEWFYFDEGVPQIYKKVQERRI